MIQLNLSPLEAEIVKQVLEDAARSAERASDLHGDGTARFLGLERVQILDRLARDVEVQQLEAMREPRLRGVR